MFVGEGRFSTNAHAALEARRFCLKSVLESSFPRSTRSAELNCSPTAWTSSFTAMSLLEAEVGIGRFKRRNRQFGSYEKRLRTVSIHRSAGNNQAERFSAAALVFRNGLKPARTLVQTSNF